MRISDWSSDVCSSDLLDRAAGDPDGARGGLNPRALEGAHQLLEPLSLGAAEQRVGGRPHRIELERIFAHPAIAEHLDLAAAHSVGGEGIGVGSARLGDRSEEHTSELQSLMRISYAVFCLKKKNNKPELTTRD